MPVIKPETVINILHPEATELRSNKKNEVAAKQLNAVNQNENPIKSSGLKMEPVLAIALLDNPNTTITILNKIVFILIIFVTH